LDLRDVSGGNAPVIRRIWVGLTDAIWSRIRVCWILALAVGLGVLALRPESDLVYLSVRLLGFAAAVDTIKLFHARRRKYLDAKQTKAREHGSDGLNDRSGGR
jgi:hypothetical protein